MAPINRLDSRDPGFASALSSLLAFEAAEDESIDRAAADILADVRHRGDAALVEYTRRFDRVQADGVQALEIPRDELARRPGVACRPRSAKGWKPPPQPRARLPRAASAARPGRYTRSRRHDAGAEKSPADRVGLYVPGGKAAYPSSVLMNAIPAKVAGVPRAGHGHAHARRRAQPHRAGRRRHRRRDRALRHRRGAGRGRAGLRHRHRARRGTRSSAPATPMSRAAKRRVFGTVGIDMIAGPAKSWSSATAARRPTGSPWTCSPRPSTTSWPSPSCCARMPPTWTKSQPPSRASCRGMPRADILRESLGKRGALILVREPGRSLRHRQRHRPRAPGDLHRVRPRSGWSASATRVPSSWAATASESLGDYCAGPNHVLPTSRTARFSSPLGVYDFREALQPDPGPGGEARRPWDAWPPSWPAAKACRRTPPAPYRIDKAMKKAPSRAAAAEGVLPLPRGGVALREQEGGYAHVRAAAAAGRARVAATVRPDIQALSGSCRRPTADDAIKLDVDGKPVRAAWTEVRDAIVGRRARHAAEPLSGRAATTRWDAAVRAAFGVPPPMPRWSCSATGPTN